MSEDRKDLIDQGRLPTRNLGECLAVDQVALATALGAQLEPSLAQTLYSAAEAGQALGISKKVAALGLGREILLLGPCLPDERQAAVDAGYIVSVSSADEAAALRHRVAAATGPDERLAADLTDFAARAQRRFDWKSAAVHLVSASRLSRDPDRARRRVRHLRFWRLR